MKKLMIKYLSIERCLLFDYTNKLAIINLRFSHRLNSLTNWSDEGKPAL